MYMSGLLDIDPSHLTHIQRKPTKGFRRFAEILSLGMLSEKEEHETFTAVAILQEINVALRSMQITDVVRFTRDGQVIYDDSDGQDENDLPLVLRDLESDKKPGNIAGFESLSLLLEHHLPDITLIIEVRVTRTHLVGKFPIQIIVNGLATEFQSEGDETALAQRLEQTFADQASYDAAQEKLKTQFENFVLQLETAVRRHMKLDDLIRHTHVNIVRPSQNSRDKTFATTSDFNGTADPVFQRYQTDSDPFLYCWMWSSLMHNHQTECRDVRIVDEHGQGLVNVGEQGFVAGQNDLLNSEEPFSASDAQELGLGSFDSGDSSGRLFSGSDAGDTSNSGGWLDSFSFGDSDSGGADSGSSCSSCGGD